MFANTTLINDNSTVLDNLFEKVSNILIEIELLQQSLDNHRNSVELSNVKNETLAIIFLCIICIGICCCIGCACKV